jgi:predicted Zn-dependent protease
MRCLAVVVLFGSLLACAEQKTATPPRVASAPLCNSIAECSAEVAEQPDDPHLRVRYARLLETAGRASAAAKEFRAAIRLAVDGLAPVDDAAEGLVRLGDPMSCLAELDGQLASAQRVPALQTALLRARATCEQAAKKL